MRRPFSTDPVRRPGVERPQAGVHRGRADLGELSSSRRSTHRVGPGELEPVQDRAGVEAPNRPPARASRPRPRSFGDRGTRPAPGTPRRWRGRGRSSGVQQVVRDAASLGERQLRRTDVHAAVDLHRIGVDDLAARCGREVEGQAVLPAGRGPDQRDDRGHRRGRFGGGCRLVWRAHQGDRDAPHRGAEPKTSRGYSRDFSMTRRTSRRRGRQPGRQDRGRHRQGRRLVDDKTGGKFGDEIDLGADKAKDALDGLDGQNNDISKQRWPSPTPPPARPGSPWSPLRTSSSSEEARASRRLSLRCCCRPERGTGYMDEHWAAAAAGHVERGETAEAAAHREAREELAVDDVDLTFVTAMQRTAHDLPIDERVSFFFAAWSWSGEPRIVESTKCADLRWFPLRRAPRAGGRCLPRGRAPEGARRPRRPRWGEELGHRFCLGRSRREPRCTPRCTYGSTSRTPKHHAVKKDSRGNFQNRVMFGCRSRLGR